jgi:hypothetical protein
VGRSDASGCGVTGWRRRRVGGSMAVAKTVRDEVVGV